MGSTSTTLRPLLLFCQKELEIVHLLTRNPDLSQTVLLQTGKFYVNLEWCEEEFSAVCTALSDSDLVAPGVDGYELTNKLMNLIFKSVTSQMQIDVLKALYFGDNSLGAVTLLSILLLTACSLTSLIQKHHIA